VKSEQIPGVHSTPNAFHCSNAARVGAIFFTGRSVRFNLTYVTQNRSPDVPVVQHAVENAMDTWPNRCSIFLCGNFGSAFVFVAPALAQENATAYEALRVVGTEIGPRRSDHVVSITGGKAPQPKNGKLF
jgi:hypothetical protein